MRNFLAVLTIICSMTGFGLAAAQSQPLAMRSQGRVDLLRQFNDSLEALAEGVSPAVVEVLVSGYGPVEQNSDSPGANTALIGRQHSLGSGVIVDSDGFIVTNAHVVEGAQRVRVMLSSRPPKAAAAATGKKTVYDARVIGVHKETDLALLNRLRPGDAVVVQVERLGKMQYLAFEFE